MRRIGMVVAALAVLVSGTAVSAEAARPQLRVSGLGGQVAVLAVPAGGMRVEYPFFDAPRVSGADGSIGGVLIQELASGDVAGGVVLQNAPGFDQALSIGLLGFDGVKLRQGRYRFTLLGQGPQSVTFRLRDRASISLAARGPARPITSSTFDADTAVHTWADPVQVPAARTIVVLGQGSGGELQQASREQSCFRPAANQDPCLVADSSSSFIAPGAGASASWATSHFEMAPEQAGAYRHSGHIVSVGAGTAAHSSVLITLPR